MKIFLIVACILLVISTAQALCYTTNSSGVPLPPHYNEDNTSIACLDGFYCQYLDVNNTATYPVYCPPSIECQRLRATGDICEPQGDFEPQLVPKGWFSEDGITIKKCPAGYFCPFGTKHPRKCPPLTVCLEGAHNKYHYGNLLWVIVTIILLFVVVKVYRAKFAFSVLVHEGDEGEGFVLSGASTPTAGGSRRNSTTNDSLTNSSENGSPKGRSRKVQLLCDGFRRRRNKIKPLNFEFSNLRVSVPTADGTMKNLLNNVSGGFAPGKVTAIMGPSGSGKTTLMNTLLGKLPPQVTRRGELLVNGEASSISKFRHLIGFVPQDDVLHQELSTYKNLYYSSEIRLPRDWSSLERTLFRSAVIDILGLTASRDVMIGDEFERGVSGGQRKRASIGLELVAAPLAMFLDEPTSGLDSFASMELCLLLREVALQTHLCVAMVIHQPRAEIWNTLDEVLILAPGGYTVYKGPQQDAQAYFAEVCEVKFPPEVNPADAIMDAVADRADELVTAWSVQSGAGVASPDKSSAIQVDDDQGWDVWHGASFLRQILLSHNRAIEKQLSVMQPFIIEFAVALLCGLILGQSLTDFGHLSTYKDPYKQISIQPFDALLPQMNLYSLMSLSLCGATAGVRVLSEPMKNYYRETAAGHNRLSFFLGSIWAAAYRWIVCVFAFATFYHTLPGFGFGFGVLYYTYLGAYFCMYALAAPISVVATKRNAPLIASLGGIISGIFSGFVDYPLWMKRLSFGFYVAQTMHLAHDDIISTAMDPSYGQWGYEDLDPRWGVVIIIAWGTIMYSIGYVFLVMFNREKQR